MIAAHSGQRAVDAAHAAMIFSLFALLTLLLSSALGRRLLHEPLDGSIAPAAAR